MPRTSKVVDHTWRQDTWRKIDKLTTDVEHLTGAVTSLTETQKANADQFAEIGKSLASLSTSLKASKGPGLTEILTTAALIGTVVGFLVGGISYIVGNNQTPIINELRNSNNLLQYRIEQLEKAAPRVSFNRSRFGV